MVDSGVHPSPLASIQMPAVAATAAESSSSASVILAKRERRLRLDKVGSYRVGRTLGRGNFAQVKIAYHDTANCKVAMKIVDKNSLDSDNLAKIEREIQILQQLCHPYIVKLFEVIRTERYLYIVTEYVTNGELFDMLMERGRQTEDESRRLFLQIVSAVAYCHAQGIVHRDLKAENLLLDKKGNIKIIDFGFSNYQQSDQLLSTWCGSPPYAAPELLLAQEYDGRQSDVWSLGVILYILVTAGFPFPGDSVDKLKRAVLGDHLKIPFWVSVECADLIRKMLTVSPVKRFTLQQVIQHRWTIVKVPDQIKRLLLSALQKANNKNNEEINNILGTGSQNNVNSGKMPHQLDPTVLVFMQQHTGWSDDQIIEEVLSRNYESPIFGTYELLLARLSEFRDAETTTIALVNSSTAGILHLESEQTRRGSRGSIISGRANVEPAEQNSCATIPTHHLAKLNLATSPEYDSDDSDSASDLGASEEIQQRYSTNHHTQQQSTSYKSRHRAYRRGRTGARGDFALTDEQKHLQSQQRLNYALEQCHQLNPLLNAAAQQFAVDTTRVWANAAAAAALFASQLQQNAAVTQQQQQLQHAAALNLVSLQNFPFVDYARIIHIPNQERRASANEALLGLNNYAHLLAACSTMGSMAGTGQGPDTRCSSSQGTSSSPRQPPTQSQPYHAYHQQQQHQTQPRNSVEEEGEFYLSGQRGSSKRNTVHSITGGIALLGGAVIQSAQSAFQRHNRAPYFKQGTASSVSGIREERRSSWASSSAGSTALSINAQQHAQLERLYRQSICQGNAAQSSAVGVGALAPDSTSSILSGVQQLQLEFQKLCANTKDNSPGAMVAATNHFLDTSQQQQLTLGNQQQMPTINITDENNQNVGSAFVPSSKTEATTGGGQQNVMPFMAQKQKAYSDDISAQSPFSQSLPNQQRRPATVCGFTNATKNNNSNATGSSPSSPIDSTLANVASPAAVKFMYIPVSINNAMERLHRFVQVHQLLCEVQSGASKDNNPSSPCLNGQRPNKTIDTVNSVQIRIAPPSSAQNPTILELFLFSMNQSPNISRATFSQIQGDPNEFEGLKTSLLALFNEVI